MEVVTRPPEAARWWEPPATAPTSAALLSSWPTMLCRGEPSEWLHSVCAAGQQIPTHVKPEKIKSCMVQLGWLLRFSQCWNHSVHLDCIHIEAWSPHPTLWLLAKFHSLWLLGWGLIFLSVSKGAGIALKAYMCSFSGGLSWTLLLEATRRSSLTWKLSKLWIFSPKRKKLSLWFFFLL